MNWRRKILMAVAAMVVAHSGVAQSPTPPATATLTGIVRDSAGGPLADVEVLLTETARATRSDAGGRFTLGNVAPGAYRVWFRRLGYASTQFDWAASARQRVEVRVVMNRLAQTLDPVVVRAQEEKEMSDRASILGLVIDTTGTPIEEAEVQLVGANRSGLTRANGGFLFRPLLVGPYVIRVRKLGFEPSVVKLSLVAGDDREVVIRMRRIAVDLDPVVVTAKSGYEPLDEQVWEDLEKRMRWKNFKTPVLGPEDLRRFAGGDVELVAQQYMLGRSKTRGYAVTSMTPGRASGDPALFSRADDESCVLLNGKSPMRRPLRIFGTSQLDLLEIYPANTELTGTIAWRMGGIPGCAARGLFDHPPYFVIWLKGSK
jgi:hypothetical protein